ncbi:MAG: pantetheine-phosphate adenylyltransferase [Planctomycetes bacterium]|nr:pantetheine-phosphate adenylyltransferase [Planctomycetota bacterium]
MASRAVYPGSFDPITYGHLDIIQRGSRVFDELLVVVADNPAKKPLFSMVERVDIMKGLTKKLKNVKIDLCEGLLVDYVRSKKANIILRGIRSFSDFEYEFQMALANRAISADIETVFIMTSEKYSYISSRLIKEAAGFGADISKFVPESVRGPLMKRIGVRK